MRKIFIICLLALLAPLGAAAAVTETRIYSWIDADGNTMYGDSIPAEYAEYPKNVHNDRGIVVDNLEGKKSAEQLEVERLVSERLARQEKRNRADQALLATYLTVEEILMHRDRRIELFQAQSKVTELYLSNLSRRLELLREDSSKYKPYSEDSSAPMIPNDLAADLKKTKDTIERHEKNLKKFEADEAEIKARFAGDISRFKVLKGLNTD